MEQPMTEQEVQKAIFQESGQPTHPCVSGLAIEDTEVVLNLTAGVTITEEFEQQIPVVSLGTSHFKEANEAARAALAQVDTVRLADVYAQRYLGCTMPTGKRLEIHGTPGNDLGCYLDGGSIEVFGNAQDQIGNTMNCGSLVIHGRCGDAAGYGMRGGEIFVRDGCGWRVGIHMKQYQDKCPVIVIGGDAGNFLGEYMAGGIIVLMGSAGEYLATGMHGGVIYVKHPIPEAHIMEGLVQEPIDATDYEQLHPLLERYCAYFEGEVDPAIQEDASWYKIRPATSRPYGSMYVS